MLIAVSLDTKAQVNGVVWPGLFWHMVGPSLATPELFASNFKVLSLTQALIWLDMSISKVPFLSESIPAASNFQEDWVRVCVLVLPAGVSSSSSLSQLIAKNRTGRKNKSFFMTLVKFVDIGQLLVMKIQS